LGKEPYASHIEPQWTLFFLRTYSFRGNK